MVDISTSNLQGSVQGLGTKVGAGINTGAIWITIALVVIGLVALVFWLRYKKSFNHFVIIKRVIGNDGGFKFDLGTPYKGRFVFADPESKDGQMHFQIFQAKKHKLNFSESMVPIDHRIPLTVKGKEVYAVIFETDTDGILHPVRVSSKENRVLEAQVTQASLQSASKAIDHLAEKYKKQDFMQKYGLLIFIILILIIAALYWWGSKSNSEAIKSVADAVAAQSQTQADMSQLIHGLINGTIKVAAGPTTTVIS